MARSVVPRVTGIVIARLPWSSNSISNMRCCATLSWPKATMMPRSQLSHHCRPMASYLTAALPSHLSAFVTARLHACMYLCIRTRACICGRTSTRASALASTMRLLRLRAILGSFWILDHVGHVGPASPWQFGGGLRHTLNHKGSHLGVRYLPLFSVMVV